MSAKTSPAPKKRRTSSQATIAHGHDLANLVCAAPVAMLVVDEDSQVLFANPAAEARLAEGASLRGARLPEPLQVSSKGSVMMRDPGGRPVIVDVGSAPIQWEGREACLLTLRDITGLKTVEGHLTRVNRLYAAFAETASAVTRAGDVRELYDEVCRIAVAFGGFRLACIVAPDPADGSVRRLSSAGPAAEFIREWCPGGGTAASKASGLVQRVLRIGVPYVCNDFSADAETLSWRARAEQHGLASMAVRPIQAGGVVAAALCVFSAETGFFASDLLTLLNQVVGEVSLGLDRLDGRGARRRAEQALQRSENRFRQMARVNPHVFWMREVASGEVVYVNPAFKAMYGLPECEALGASAVWIDSVHVDDRPRAQTLQREGREGRPAVGRYRIVRPDGTVRWVEEEVFPIFENGQLLRLTGNVVDITERHEADGRSRMLEALIAASDNGYYILRPSDRFRLVYINDAGVRHFGRPREKLLGQSVWDWNPGFTPEACAGAWATIQREGSITFETEHRIEGGAIANVEITATYLRLGDEELIAGVFRNIDARIRVEAELREKNERLREQAMLLDAASDAIILRRLDGTIEFWSRGAEKLFGWSPEEALGRNAGELLFRDRDGAQVREIHARVLRDGLWNGEIEHLTKGGRRILVESRCTLVRDSADAPSGILTINTDVTEKKRIEAGVLRAQRLESIGTLAGGIAHDLNNILAPIVLSGDMLMCRHGDGPDGELIDTICASARRGADVVRQVMSFARGVESTRVPVNLRHILPDLRKILRETFPRNITMKVCAADDIWCVPADPTQLHQVMLNLCLNAADAMPSGGTLTVTAENATLDATFAGLTPGAHPGPHVCIKVSDTGTGIPEEIRHRVFDPFFTTKSLGRGTGLGLSTALAIARSHAGFINFESEPGEGTVFSVFLPAETEASPVSATPSTGALPQGRGELVLVIDDEQSVRSIMRQSLEGAGYRVIDAEDGAEGINRYVESREQVSLVLTDMMMPVMDGLAVVTALQEVAPNLSIIAMGGVADNPDCDRAAGLPEGVSFLLKPFTLESLLTTLRDVLDVPARKA